MLRLGVEGRLACGQCAAGVRLLLLYRGNRGAQLLQRRLGGGAARCSVRIFLSQRCKLDLGTFAGSASGLHCAVLACRRTALTCRVLLQCPPLRAQAIQLPLCFVPFADGSAHVSCHRGVLFRCRDELCFALTARRLNHGGARTGFPERVLAGVQDGLLFRFARNQAIDLMCQLVQSALLDEHLRLQLGAPCIGFAAARFGFGAALLDRFERLLGGSEGLAFTLNVGLKAR